MAALLNPKVWIAAALVALLAFTHFFVYRAGRASLRGEFDAYKIAQQEARILADKARTQRAEQRQQAVDKEARDGQQQIASLETQLGIVRADGERMRDLYVAAAERARALARAAASGPGQPDPDPIGVFAGLLERADRRAEAVGSYAQKLRIAGAVCERSWDAVKAK